MSARFKSRDDYFSRRDSSLAERVIAAKTPKPGGRKRSVEGAIPSAFLRVHFCKTVEQFEIEGRGRYRKGEYPLDDALRSHLGGEETVLVNPLSGDGETAFTVVRFDLSEAMDLPFSKARQYADELLVHGIPSLIEVAEGGKGHYHLWVFHEEPVNAMPFSDALARLGRRMFGVTLDTIPSIRGDECIALPLQGESALLQRRVFVNAVGKMIKDQGNVLQSIEYCPKVRSEAFIAAMAAPERQTSPVRPVFAVPPAPAIPATARTEVSAAEIPPKPVIPAPLSRPVPPAEPAPVVKPVSVPVTPTHPVASVSAGTPVQPSGPMEPVIASSIAARASEPVKTPVVEAAAPKPVHAPVPEPEAKEPPKETVSIKAITPSPAPEPVSRKTVPEPEKPVPPVAVPPSAVPREKSGDAVFLVFSRAGKSFAIDVADVERVTGTREMTAVAGVGNIRGTIERNGRAIAVLDPVENADMPVRGRIVISRSGGAILADRIAGPETLERVSSTVAVRADGGQLSIPAVDHSVSGADIHAARPEKLAARVHVTGGRYVLFALGERLYGIPADVVGEVLPGSARNGIDAEIPYGGGGLPLLDLRPEAGRPLSRRERILVFGSAGPEAGLCVNAVEGIRMLVPGEADAGNVSVPGLPVIAVVRFDGVDSAVSILDSTRIAATGSPA